MSTSSIALPRLRRLPPRALVVAAFASLTGFGEASLHGWPLWAIATLTIVPWVPPLAVATVRAYRDAAWLGLFFVLALSQTAHLLEHIAQMLQIHAFHLSGPAARGIFGNLDIEWVHFTWNAWVQLAIVALLFHYRGNRWLWVAAAIAGWHVVEHSYILWIYLTTGVPGTPGLASSGGVLAGGLPLKRPDLHFLYNLAETLPLVVAFARAARGGIRSEAVGPAPR